MIKQKFIFDIKGQEIELSKEEVEELYNELKEILGFRKSEQQHTAAINEYQSQQNNTRPLKSDDIKNIVGDTSFSTKGPKQNFQKKVNPVSKDLKDQLQKLNVKV